MDFGKLDFKRNIDIVIALRDSFKDCTLMNIFFDNLGNPILHMETKDKYLKFKITDVEEIKID
jgi:hypothetical protein